MVSSLSLPLLFPREFLAILLVFFLLCNSSPYFMVSSISLLLVFPMGFLALLIPSSLASQFDTLLNSFEGGSFWQVMPLCPLPWPFMISIGIFGNFIAILLTLGFLANLIASLLASQSSWRAFPCPEESLDLPLVGFGIPETLTV